MYLAGIDIGTTGCKCTVYDDKGSFITEAYQEYSTEITSDYHTINPNVVLESTKNILKKIAVTVNSLEAICVASFGESSVLLDEEDNPLCNSYLYTDPNGEAECDSIENALGSEYIYKHTGLAPNIMYSISKLKWQKEQFPNVWEKVKSICLFEDFIVYKLSGIRQIDYSLATRTMAFDVHNLCWDENILAIAGIDSKMLSRPVPTGSLAGYMTKEMAHELGFVNTPCIVSGCHDQIAAVIGSGVTKKNQAVDGTGTVECMSCTYGEDENVCEQQLNDGGYAIVPYSEKCYVTYAFSYTGGALLKWYRDKIANVESAEMKKKGENPYAAFNKLVCLDQPSGLLIVPHFAGAGTPYMDDDAKGILYGLTMETSKAQIYQGLMEGATYEMRLNLEILEQAGVHFDEIFATGGGASSKEWLQIKADILGKNVVSLETAESGTLACIMLAGVACGIYRSLEEAGTIFVRYKDRYEPRENMKEKYDVLFEQYKNIYPGIMSRKSV